MQKNLYSILEKCTLISKEQKQYIKEQVQNQDSTLTEILQKNRCVNTLQHKLKGLGKKGKENQKRSEFHQRSCPDLWTLTNQPQSAETIFDELFPSPSHKRIDCIRCHHPIMGNHDSLTFEQVGVILDKQYPSQPNKVKTFFQKYAKLNKLKPENLTLFNASIIQKIFEEVDLENKGYITYWELYLHRNIYLLKQLL